MDSHFGINDLTLKIKAEANRLGFFRCGIAPYQILSEDLVHLNEWNKTGMNAGMDYMTRNLEVRQNVRNLVENANSVIVVLQPYYTDNTPVNHESPIVSKYALGKDYHFVVKDKLRILAENLKIFNPDAQFRVFTDSAPVFERRWAQLAGLGWLGKNSNLINKDGGSFFFIGEIITDQVLDYDQPYTENYCGNCTRCIDNCPTEAIVSPGIIDANRCISYNTIELKGEINQSLKGRFGNRIFGCDICQDVCPWNRKAIRHQEPLFEPHPELLQLSAEEWKTLSQQHYKEIFKGTPVDRAGYKGLKRNIDFIFL